MGGSRIWEREMSKNSKMEIILFKKGYIPSRLNTSYRFTVKNSEKFFSTDIATGAKSHVYPSKFSHWGSGVVSKEWKTSILLRNFSHTRDCEDNIGKLTLFFNNDEQLNHKFEIKNLYHENLS